MSVRAILRTKGQRVITVRQDTTIEEVVATLSREKIGAVVVSDDGATVDGLVSERDIINGLSKQGAKLPAMTARDLMTRSVTHAKIDTPLLDILDTMTQGRFRHMPILENGRLVGMVSIGDAVKARLEMLETETMQMKDYIAGR
jgi:CBS domain-containing protein